MAGPLYRNGSARSPRKGDGNQPGVVRVPLHRVPKRQRVPLRGGAGRQGAQQRLGQCDQAGHGGERIARQADEVRASPRSGAPAASGDRDAPRPRPPAAPRRDAAAWRWTWSTGPARGRPAGGDHDIGTIRSALTGNRPPARRPRRPRPAVRRRRRRRARAASGGSTRAQRVPDQPAVRQPLAEQLVAEHEHGGAGPGDDGAACRTPPPATGPPTRGVLAGPRHGAGRGAGTGDDHRGAGVGAGREHPVEQRPSPDPHGRLVGAAQPAGPRRRRARRRRTRRVGRRARRHAGCRARRRVARTRSPPSMRAPAITGNAGARGEGTSGPPGNGPGRTVTVRASAAAPRLFHAVGHVPAGTRPPCRRRTPGGRR
ncbi:hypothetical protein SALBM217S_02860 [Streptomyces griseoloalbus]